MIDKNIFIYGVPGSGKTTLAEALEKSLHLTNLELDEIRTEEQQGKMKESNPFLFEYTTTAWQHFAKQLTPESAVQGLLAIRSALLFPVTKVLNKHTDIVLAEAAFIDPNDLFNKGSCFLVSTPDKKQHFEQFFAHRTKSPNSEEQFMAARFIDDFLIDEAQKLNINIIKNYGNLDELIQKVTTIVQTK
jgi:2-phosphoglycerate kinase